MRRGTYNGHSAIRSHCNEEERSVLEIVPVMDGDEDGEAGNGDTDSEECEEEAMAGLVGEVGHEHGKAKGGSPRRNRMYCAGASLVYDS